MAVAIPVWMWVVGAAAAAVGAYAQVKSAQATSDAADYNKKIAQQNAAAATQQGLQAQTQQRQDAERKLGMMSANFGASGVDPTTGTPLDVMSDSVQQSTLDNLNVKYNYQMRALGYQNSATLDSAASDNATTSGYLSAAGTALGGAGSAMKSYQSANGVPVTGN